MLLSYLSHLRPFQSSASALITAHLGQLNSLNRPAERASLSPGFYFLSQTPLCCWVNHPRVRPQLYATLSYSHKAWCMLPYNHIPYVITCCLSHSTHCHTIISHTVIIYCVSHGTHYYKSYHMLSHIMSQDTNHHTIKFCPLLHHISHSTH